jgi:hypothetical protein
MRQRFDAGHRSNGLQTGMSPMHYYACPRGLKRRRRWTSGTQLESDETFTSGLVRPASITSTTRTWLSEPPQATNAAGNCGYRPSSQAARHGGAGELVWVYVVGRSNDTRGCCSDCEYWKGTACSRKWVKSTLFTSGVPTWRST